MEAGAVLKQKPSPEIAPASHGGVELSGRLSVGPRPHVRRAACGAAPCSPAWRHLSRPCGSGQVPQPAVLALRPEGSKPMLVHATASRSGYSGHPIGPGACNVPLAPLFLDLRSLQDPPS